MPRGNDDHLFIQRDEELDDDLFEMCIEDEDEGEDADFELSKQEDTRASFELHMKELCSRVFFLCFSILLMQVLFFYYGLDVINLLCSHAGWLGVDKCIILMADFWYRLIWAHFFASLFAHYIFIYHVVKFIFPGLYFEERRQVRPVVMAALLMPFVSFIVTCICALLMTWIYENYFFTLDELRYLSIKLYLVQCLSLGLMTIPRVKNRLSVAIFLILGFVIFFVPDHFYDSVTAIFIELNAFTLIVATFFWVFFAGASYNKTYG